MIKSLRFYVNLNMNKLNTIFQKIKKLNTKNIYTKILKSNQIQTYNSTNLE